MSLLKLNGGAGAALMALALLASSSQAARAEATTLICNLDSSNPWKEAEPTTIELNEAQSTVVVHFAAMHGDPRYGGGSRIAVSYGPLPAKFGTDTITFSVDRTTSSWSEGPHTINRLTGNFVEAETNWKWNCHPAKKQF